MFSYKNSDQFIKCNNFLFKKEDITFIDCNHIESLKIKIKIKSNEEFVIEGITALELIMQIKPSMLEGKRLKWHKNMWLIHNMIGHPLMNVFALFRCYKLAFWIHEITIPKPLGAK